MPKEFRLEDPGEGIHEAEIREINVSAGDEVADGDVLFTVETDKAAVEVPSPFAGEIEKIHVGEGDIAKVGDVLVTYRESGDAEDKESKASDKGDGEAAKDEGREPRRGHEKEREDEDETEPEQSTAVEEETNKRTKTSDKREAAPDGAKGEPDSNRPDEGARSSEGSASPVPASPATRRRAREMGVSLSEVEGSGPGGRVTLDDLDEHGQSVSRETDDESEEGGGARAEHDDTGRAEGDSALPDFTEWGDVERTPLRSVRRATARHMARSWAQIPHVMHHDVVDITELEAFRQEHKAAVEEQGGKLTLTVLVMKALIAALKEHPRFNASLDLQREEIVLKQYFNIGVAVDTEAGLLVPVVHDADRKSISELAVELETIVKKAQDGALEPSEMRGGTITITNPGPLGGRLFTPIINAPEVAILGIAQARLEAQVRGPLEQYEIVPRQVLPFCFAFDHRVNDGADAARFAQTFVDVLSDTDSILLRT